MSVIELQNSLIQMIKGIKDENTLKKIRESVLQSTSPTSKVDERALIKALLEKSKAEIETGQFKSHDQVMQDTSEWLQNL